MFEFFFSIDKAVLYFFNQIIANSIFDYLMPLITDWHKLLIPRLFLLTITAYLLFFQGKKGRILLLFVVVVIILTDQLSSSVIKPLVARPRPCHLINGYTVVDNLRLLVSCGPGFSMPSSHSANHFAVALIVSYFYRNLKYILFSFATIVAISRVYVGVHFPADVMIGALVGIVCSFIIYRTYLQVEKYFHRK